MRRIWLSSLMAIVLAGCTTSPQPITDVEGQEAAAEWKANIRAFDNSYSGELTLYEAMARALKHNLDHRIAMMEIDFARADYEVSRYNRWPNVVANGGVNGLNNQQGSSNLSLISGRQSLEPSTANERIYRAGGLKATWNVLDFGLSRIRSEQLADESLIYEERRRKAIIQIINDVQHAYWQAVSAQRLRARLSDVEEDVQKALADSRALYSLRNTSPLTALSYQRELTDIQGQAESLLNDLSLSKVTLAGLIGLSPHHPLTLQVVFPSEAPQSPALGLQEMIDLSLRYRPEVREAFYRARIGEKEIKKTVLETLPSLEAFMGMSANSNDFLYHSNWADYGARASWNILQIFSLGQRKRKAKAKVVLEKERGLAAAAAVVTQLAIARAAYENAVEEYLAAKDGAQIQRDILNQVEGLSKAGSVSEQVFLKERMNSLISEARRDLLQVELKQAAAQIYASMGVDPYGADIRGDEDVALIAARLQAQWGARNPYQKYEADMSAQAASDVLRNKYDHQT